MGHGLRRHPAPALALVIALLGACACAGRSEHRVEQTFDAARLALRKGELADAMGWADQGVALTRSQPDSVWAWRLRLLREEILVAQLRLPEVLPLLSVSLPGGSQFDRLRVRQKYIEARTQVIQGRLQGALDTMDNATSAAPAEWDDVRLDVEVLGGQVRLRLGRWADAESRLNQVVARAAATGDRYHQALALNNLGMSQLVRNRWDEALSWFERVLSFADLEQTTVHGAALTNAGICYWRLGQFERAEAILRRAVDVHEHRGPRGDFEQALGELGDTYLQQGDNSRGLPYLQRALAVAVEANLTADAAIWARNLAAAQADLGQWDEAERVNNESKRLRPASSRSKLVWNTLTAARIAAGRGQLDEATRLFGEAVAGSEGEPEVRWSAHAALADAAIAARRPGVAAQHFEAALHTIEQTRFEFRKPDNEFSYLASLIRFYQAYVDALIDQGRVERALEIAESSRGRVLAERQGVTAPAMANAAAFRRMATQSRAVLLSYWLAPARSYMWIVTASGIRCVHLPSSNEIERLAREYQATVENALADPLASAGAAGDRLYQLLVEPALPSISPGAPVLIVPDGGLHGLNFETLPVPGVRRHFLIEDAQIQIAPSLALLAVNGASPALPRSLLLVGNPTPRNPEFPALRYASAEMTDITQHFSTGHVSSYQGDSASPGAYRGARPDQFAFVHFTAHAAANFDSPLDSAVILAGPENAFKLYARDVADQPLRAELVTVSACRSAGEHAYSGEGLVGFAWAFLRAGARRVIAGLWDVDDESTAALMNQLYAGITAGHSPARSLRDAKLDLIHRGGRFVKPYYWGPFELFTVSP
jgi:CHAT domain-containing protein